MNSAAAAVGHRPEFFDSLDQTRGTVTDHQPRRWQSTTHEIAAEIEPVFVRLALAETYRQQHAFAFGRVAPDHQHALFLTAWSRGQVRGVHKQGDDRDIGQTLVAEGGVAIAQFAADPTDR